MSDNDEDFFEEDVPEINSTSSPPLNNSQLIPNIPPENPVSSTLNAKTTAKKGTKADLGPYTSNNTGTNAKQSSSFVEIPEEKTKKSGKYVRNNRKLSADEIIMLKKQGSKSRVKTKVLGSIVSYKTLEAAGPPTFILRMIRNKKFIFKAPTPSESFECLQFFKKYNKHQIALSFFVAARDAEEVSFVKTVLMKRDFFNVLFSHINPL